MCDYCGSDDNVLRWRLGRLDVDPKTINLDLCQEHGEPFRTALEKKPRGTTRRPVVPLSEVKKRIKKP